MGDNDDKTNDNGSGEYVVERIVDKRDVNGDIEYFVKWLDYPDDQNTWVPADRCNCPALITEYEDLRKSGATGMSLSNKPEQTAKGKTSSAVNAAIKESLQQKLDEVEKLRKERQNEQLLFEHANNSQIQWNYRPLFEESSAPTASTASTATPTQTNIAPAPNPTSSSNETIPPPASNPGPFAYRNAIQELKAENAEMKAQIAQMVVWTWKKSDAQIPIRLRLFHKQFRRLSNSQYHRPLHLTLQHHRQSNSSTDHESLPSVATMSRLGFFNWKRFSTDAISRTMMQPNTKPSLQL